MSNEEALKMVRKDGNDLRFVKEQTPEICLEAVKQNGMALRYVKEQTPEICLEAVKQNGYALECVKDKSMLSNTPKPNQNKSEVMSIF